MRKFATVSLLSLATLTLGFGADKPQTFTGTVSDAMCGAKHTMPGNDAECTKACVKEGSGYALVVGNKVYKLTGKTDGLDALAGEQAKVTGTQDGDKINVESVSAAK